MDASPSGTPPGGMFSRVREIPGAGHMGAWVEPQSYADELVRFFENHLTPA